MEINGILFISEHHFRQTLINDMNEKQIEKEQKLGEWGVIDGPLMREVLDNYLVNPDFSEKVLEIQRLKSIVTKPRIRAFIGQKIKMKDYPAWNGPQIKTLNNMREHAISMNVDIPDLTDSISALCIWEEGPRITPLVRLDNFDGESYMTSEMFRCIFGTSIMNESEIQELKPKFKYNLDISLWLHLNDKGKFVLPKVKTDLEPKFRIRSINFEDWKEITADYISRGCVCPEYVERDDISLKQVEL